MKKIKPKLILELKAFRQSEMIVPIDFHAFGNDKFMLVIDGKIASYDMTKLSRVSAPEKSTVRIYVYEDMRA